MEIKMATGNDTKAITSSEPSMVQMESLNRIAHLPTVEQTVYAATSIYGAVKDYSSVTNWTLATAESTAYKAVQIGKPIICQFEGPIKKVDEILCNGLDYVEEKIPAVKLPPGEIIFQLYTTTKDYVGNKIQPAVDAAKHIVEPAVKIAEPYVQPAVDTAFAIKDYGYQKVGEMLHRNQESKTAENPGDECKDCNEPAQKSQSFQSE